MMAATHVALGILSWLGIAKATGASTASGTLALAALGSLLPDIDHPKSSIGRRVPFMSWPLAALFGHRGVTHSLLSVALGLVALVATGGDGIAAPLVVGHFSHLAGDYFTRAGVALLYPDRRVFVSPWAIRTGSLVEVVLAAVLVLALIFTSYA